MEIEFHHSSITPDTTMILKNYKTTENRYKKAQKQKKLILQKKRNKYAVIIIEFD